MKYYFLMAVNKYQPFLKASIDSVLSQTCADFSFYIIANNCNEELWEFLEKIDDPRIFLHRTTIGQLAYSLNLGLDQIEDGYILRMDADDISLPERLELTKSALKNAHYPDILAGSAYLINTQGSINGSVVVNSDKNALTESLWFKNPIVHPATAIRVKTIKRLHGYSGGLMSEDIDLWLRASRDETVRFVGISVPLIKYRIHSDQARRKRLGYAEGAGYRIREFIIQKKVKFLCGAFIGVLKAFIRGV